MDDVSEQAGDPFEESGITPRPGFPVQGVSTEESGKTEEPVDRVAEIQSLQEGRIPETTEFEAAKSVLDEFEFNREAEAEVAEHVTLSVEEIRALVKTTSQAVEDATVNLEKARKAYQLAGLLQVEQKAKPTLVELNQGQVKVTAKEVRHKNRAMKALGELGFGDPKPKPHPRLF